MSHYWLLMVRGSIGFGFRSGGANRKSALYEDGERVDRLDNENILDQLETRIRAKASQLIKGNVFRSNNITSNKETVFRYSVGRLYLSF